MEPNNEDGLEHEIPGEVVENDAKSKALEEVEETEHDPIRKPLDVILGSRRLDSLERQVGRESPTHEVGYGCCERVDEMEESEEGESSQDGVRLGDLRALFKGVKDGVFRELRRRFKMRLPRKKGNETNLFVELIEIEASLVLDLDENRVLLHFLCCRHLVNGVRKKRKNTRKRQGKGEKETSKDDVRLKSEGFVGEILGKRRLWGGGEEGGGWRRKNLKLIPLMTFVCPAHVSFSPAENNHVLSHHATLQRRQGMPLTLTDSFQLFKHSHRCRHYPARYHRFPRQFRWGCCLILPSLSSRQLLFSLSISRRMSILCLVVYTPDTYALQATKRYPSHPGNSRRIRSQHPRRFRCCCPILQRRGIRIDAAVLAPYNNIMASGWTRNSVVDTPAMLALDTLPEHDVSQHVLSRCAQHNPPYTE